MYRVIFHLDMDAFYASIEQRDHPGWKGKPVVVGASPDRRGVVCAASYEVRRFGVRSAMPSATARRLCPSAIFVEPRMNHYRRESERIMEIVSSVAPAIEQVSIDEAYLDVSSICQADDADTSLVAAVPIARNLKEQIFSRRRLTTSIGIASNKLLAKIASDFQKPNGLTLIPERDKAEFLRPMPVRTIHGIGKVSEQILNGAGIRTVGDLQDYRGDLRALVGSFGVVLKRFAFGQDDRPLEFGGESKSISSENTFSRNTDDRQVLRRCLREQAAEIADKLARKELGAETVQVKVRYGDFKTLTRQITVEEPITSASEIYRLGCYLLAKDRLVSAPLRLLGLGVANLAPVQQLRLAL